MYMITEAEGKIRIPPSKLGQDIDAIVGEVSHEQFEGKMEQDRSLTILVDNVRAEGLGLIVHGDGAVHQTVKYRRLAYIPRTERLSKVSSLRSASTARSSGSAPSTVCSTSAR